uniref:Uncharacterized protein n=1 Tax=Oryza rufipogon TaxID=4529 RepID=A0A0E0NCJ5_ORYRU
MELEKRLAYQANTGVARRNGGTAGCEARPSHDRQGRAGVHLPSPPYGVRQSPPPPASCGASIELRLSSPLSLSLSLSLSSPLASRGLLRRRFL